MRYICSVIATKVNFTGECRIFGLYRCLRNRKNLRVAQNTPPTPVECLFQGLQRLQKFKGFSMAPRSLRLVFLFLSLISLPLVCEAGTDAVSLLSGDELSPVSQKASVPLTPSATEGDAAQISARFFTRFHYQPKPLNDAMSAEIFDAYMASLDPDKVFFTQADVTSLSLLKATLDDAIWGKKLDGPFSIFNRYMYRVADRMTFARSLLKRGFDFTINDTYRFVRKTADVPKDDSQLDALWRKRTMNDWLRLKLAGKDDAAIRSILDKRYAKIIVRTRQLTRDDAFEAFMTAYAHAMDPHTDYFVPQEADEFDIAMGLSLEGIGAYLGLAGDYVTVSDLVPGGPAQLSGNVAVGDRIAAVGEGKNGPMVDVIGWRQDDVVRLIRGKKGTLVRLEILPAKGGTEAKHQDVVLVRRKVTEQEQAARVKLVQWKGDGVDHRIGVIELPSFYEDFGARKAGDPNYKSASHDAARLLAQLKAEEVEGVVVDLRDNGGGSLDEAIELTSLFVGKGPVVQVRKSGGDIEVQGSDRRQPVWTGPMAVLVNRGSASASEIFAAAIQDYGRGVIIGSPTFGKGTVQDLLNLDEISGQPKSGFGELKMTVAEFIRINGDSTQRHGVTPDVEFPSSNAADQGESGYSNALPWRHIAPASYRPLADMKPLIGTLRSEHADRVGVSASWKLMMDEVAAYQAESDQTEVSLNYEVRKAERDRLNKIQTAFRARQEKIDGKNNPDNMSSTSSSDDGLQADERAFRSDAALRNAQRKRIDPQLREAANILHDAYCLIDAEWKPGVKAHA
jgi:carboxyl-terminal processing protease